MMQYTEESCGVFALPLYEASSCALIVAHVKSLGEWEGAQVFHGAEDGGGAWPDLRSASVLTPIQGSEIYREFDEKMDQVIKPLVKRLWRVDLQEHSGTHLVRYAPGGHYVAHRDVGAECWDRYFTVVCYLNDDFEGGGTRFPSLNYSAVPECGKAILFPARYIHCAQPVIKGEKYVLVSWVLGPAPIAWV